MIGKRTQSTLFGMLAAIAWMTSSVAEAEVTRVSKVDLTRAAGSWYVVAISPDAPEAGCACATADFTLKTATTLTVRNSCRRGGPGGRPLTLTGNGTVLDPGTAFHGIRLDQVSRFGKPRGFTDYEKMTR